MAREPSESSKASVAEAVRLRGQIIGSYSQVEHLITDIVLRARVLACYRHLPEGLPYKLATRIQRVQTLFRTPGPLLKYADEAMPLLDGLTAYEAIRVMMAHGLFILEARTNPHTFEFRMYRAEKGNVISEGLMETDAQQLRFAAREITDYAQAVVVLFHRIYLAERLQEV